MLVPTLHTPVRAPTAHSDGRESRRAATNLDVWGGPWGTELQPVCAPPCAPQAVCRAGNSCECSLGYEGDGRTCTGEPGRRAHSPPIPSGALPDPTPSSPPPVVDLCQEGRGGCSEHANCSQVGTAVTCICWPDYEGDGWSCRARNPCEDGLRGGCSEHADCLNTGPVSRGSQATGLGGVPPILAAPGPKGCPPALLPQNTRRCVCHTGYVGDGLQCLLEPEPPVDRCLDRPPPCHADAVCTDLHFQGVLPCPLPAPSLSRVVAH